MLPDLESLRLLADLSRLGSIGAAGRAAGISQQSASERIRAMEAQTGVVLVQRAARGSTLTEAGRLLVGWSADLLARADEIEEALTTLRHERRRELHVAASMTTAEFLLPGWLVRLRQASDIAIALQASNTEDVLRAVRSGTAAIGFIEGPADLQGLSSTVVAADELVLVAAPDDEWARRRRPLTPRLVAARPLTSREQGSGCRAVVAQGLAALGIQQAAPQVELTTNPAVAAGVRAGGAPAFLSRWVVQRDLDVGTLVEVPVADLDLVRDLRAVWIGGARPPAGPLRDLLAIARHTAST
ncbi:LysR family transcriptional regulator [Nocardioides sp.]|uniref:LysR family transcriptional regulator n=1 Tax=Nocardioides sp. TaxID=35761 RepID=UPI00261570C7|nr:LysR family transcriptional regulator [Nocardioides sp.]